MKKKPFPVDVHTVVKRHINRPERQNNNFCQLEVMCDNFQDCENSFLLAVTENWLSKKNIRHLSFIIRFWNTVLDRSKLQQHGRKKWRLSPVHQ